MGTEVQDAVDRAEARAAAAVEMMDRKLRDMEMLVRSMIVASGGVISVPNGILRRYENAEFIQEADLANDRIRFRVKI